MRNTDQTTRRKVLKIAGAAGGTALVAGCGGGGGGGGGDGGNGEENGGGNGGGNGGEAELIEPGTEIMLEGTTEAWQGMEPEQIADQENPTLALTSGESYDITFENGDGAQHNLEIVDENDEVVDDYSTDLVEEQGETATLQVDEITDEMAEYVCRPHESTMRGPIEVQEGEGGGGGGGNETEDGNETEGNETEGGNETDGGNETENGEENETDS